MTSNIHDVLSIPLGRRKFMTEMINAGIPPELLQKTIESVRTWPSNVYPFQIVVDDVIFNVDSETTFDDLAKSCSQRTGNMKEINFRIMRTKKLVNGNDSRLLVKLLKPNDILSIIC